MRLRPVRPDDVDAYVRMRCDPVMMAELGGPLPPDGMAGKVRADAEATAAGADMTMMIVLDGPETGKPADEPGVAAPETVAGSVTLWPHAGGGTGPADGAAGGVVFWEIGWMVLPAYQGRGLAKRAVRSLLSAWARDRGHVEPVHAFPGVTNGPSNGICRSLGFRLVGEQDTTFAGRVLRVNHWTLDPAHVPPH